MNTDVIMLIIMIVIIGLDFWLYSDDIEGNSFSQRIIKLSRKHPSLPLFGGYLIGHLWG